MTHLTHNTIDQPTWDAFVLVHGPRSGRFLQSWGWGEVVKKSRSQEVENGEEVDRIAWMSDAGDVQAVAQVIRKTIPYFGTYAYVPRGPIEAKTPSSFEEGAGPCLPAGRGGRSSIDLISDLVDLSKGDLFIRIEPPTQQETDLTRDLIHSLSLEKILVTKAMSVQPSHTFITNLSISTDELLANMHEKTRYNIRLAEKKGVCIELSPLREGGVGGGRVTFDEVWPVFESTASRDGFRLHGKDYYRKMLGEKREVEKSRSREGKRDGEFCAFLAIAKHEDDILAANIMIDFGDTRTYLHGASSNVKRNFMAPYLLHWELMKDAKSRGITSYDWWGVAPVDAPSTHPWAGISRFKRGFGGEDIAYFGAVDVVVTGWMYLLYRIAFRVKRIWK